MSRFISTLRGGINTQNTLWLYLVIPQRAKANHSFQKHEWLQKMCITSSTIFFKVFHAPSHGVICFARSVSLRKHFLTGENSLAANQKLLLSWFSKLTLQAKCIPSYESARKTAPENGVRSCVHFCLRSLLHLEKCVFVCGHLSQTVTL